MLGKKLWEELLFLFGLRVAVELHREIVAHHYVLSHRGGFLDKVFEVRVELRRPARNVDVGYRRLLGQHLQARVDRETRHLLGTFWRRVNMAVVTCLVAKLGDIDLQRVERKWRKIDRRFFQMSIKVVDVVGHLSPVVFKTVVHLNAVNKGDASLHRRRDMNRFGHLFGV